MNVDYDAETDALCVTLREGRILDSDEVRPGVVADYDAAGQVLGFEVLSASKVMEDFALAGFGSPITGGRLREEPGEYKA